MRSVIRNLLKQILQRSKIKTLEQLFAPSWYVEAEVEKYKRDSDGELLLCDVVKQSGNALLLRGANMMWASLASDSNMGSNPYKFFNNANTYVYVGNDSTSVDITDEVGGGFGSTVATATMMSGYPMYALDDGSTYDWKIIYKGEFADDTSQFTWEEWGLANAGAIATPTMSFLNRKVWNIGTKEASDVWRLKITITLG